MTLLQFFTGFGITIATVVCTCIAPFRSLFIKYSPDMSDVNAKKKRGGIAMMIWFITSLALGICISIIIFSR